MESTDDEKIFPVPSILIIHELLNVSKLPRIIDYVKDTNGLMEGEKKSMADVLNKPICILSVKEDIPSQFRNYNGTQGTYAAIQFFYASDDEQNRFRLNTGSEVLRDKLKQFQDQLELPAIGIIRKIGKYYTFC